MIYLSKPFHKDELIARIHALVRRSKGHAQSLIAVGDLIVNLEARNVELHGQKLHLTAKEYQILALLALRIGSTLTKETFLNHLYGGLDDEPEAKIIDVFICKLRKKLANDDRIHPIDAAVTVRAGKLQPLCPAGLPAIAFSSSRSPSARDGHRFESPPLHQELRAIALIAIAAGRRSAKPATLYMLRSLVDDAEMRYINVAEWTSGADLERGYANPEWQASVQPLLKDPDLHTARLRGRLGTASRRGSVVKEARP